MKLTALGQMLATLPVEAQAGKLMILGACFGVWEEATTLAAGPSLKSMFAERESRQDM
jgi:HrpA-like RNA helicase